MHSAISTCQNGNMRLPNMQLDKLKSAAKNATNVTVRLAKKTGRFLARLLGTLIKTELPLMKNLLTPLVKSVLKPLGLIVAVADTGIHFLRSETYVQDKQN